MHSRNIISVGLLAHLIAATPAVLAQSIDELDENCVLACQLERSTVSKDCDCDAVTTAFALMGTSSSNNPSPPSVGTALELINELKAQYDAEMADVENYYFLEQTWVLPPRDLTIPGYEGDMPSSVRLPPAVRYFEGEMDENGEKVFRQLSPAELAKRDPTAPSGPEVSYADLANAYSIFGAAAPENAAGDLLRNLTGATSALLMEMDAGVNAAASEGAGDATGDVFSTAILRELWMMGNLSDFAESQPVYLGYYKPGNLRNPGKFILDPTKFCLRGCPSEPSLFALNLSNQYAEYLLSRGYKALGVIILEPPSSTVVTWEGHDYVLKKAELWCQFCDEDRYAGPSVQPRHLIRSRVEYRRSVDGGGYENVVIDQMWEDWWEWEPGTVWVPTVRRQLIYGSDGIKPMESRKFLSKMKFNAGPPTQEEVAVLIGDAMGDVMGVGDLE